MKVIKNKNKMLFFVATTLVVGSLLYIFPPHFESTNAKEITGTGSASGETEFSVNVEETLSMTVTPPSESGWAKDDVNKFLRNEITVAVSSNNGQGFTTGMTTLTSDTSLAHTSDGNVVDSKDTIPTLAGQTTARGGSSDNVFTGFEANRWGYSLDDTSGTGKYSALVGAGSTPITITSSATQASKTQKVYFGAKADTKKLSGTYKGTVVFKTTSGTAGSSLPSSTPSGIEGPSAIANAPANANAYTYTTNQRTYSANNYGTPAAEDSQVATTSGKRSTASDYASPLGAIEHTNSNVQSGSGVSRVLAITALSAAGVGSVMFVLAKRNS